MTFGSVVRIIRAGQAAKPATFNGYMYRADRQESSYSVASDAQEFYLRFKRRVDESSGDDDSFFVRVPSSDRNKRIIRHVPRPGRPDESGMPVNGELFHAIALGDWAVGDKSDFEDARTGAGGKVW